MRRQTGSRRNEDGRKTTGFDWHELENRSVLGENRSVQR